MSRAIIDVGTSGSSEPTWVPMSDLDRMSGNDRIVYVGGPFQMPPREQIVERLTAMAAFGPQTRIGLQLAEDLQGWTYDATRLREWCDALVVEIPPIGPGESLALHREYLSEDEIGRPPIQFLLAGDYAVLRMTHLLGDSNLLLGAFTAAVQPLDAPLPAWVTEPATPRPLAAALRETFVKKPSLLREVVRSQRSRTHAERPTASSGTTIPWTRGADSAYARFTKPQLNALKAWTRSAGGSISLGSALLVAFRRALVAEGIRVQGESTLVYSVRPYLPGGSQTNGNFIAGLPIPAGHTDDPRLVNQVIKDNVSAASPLAALAYGAARARMMRGRKGSPRESVSSCPTASVVMSNAGVQRELDTLPWQVDSASSDFIVWSEPMAPESIGIDLIIVRGVMHATIVFHSNVFSTERIQAALDRTVTDACSLLDETS